MKDAMRAALVASMEDLAKDMKASFSEPVKQSKSKSRSWKEAGVYVERKFDGVHCQLTKVGDKVTIITEDGNDCTKSLPTLADDLASVKGDWILACELESWQDGLHQNRGVTAGILNSKEPHEHESSVRANAFDCVWHGSDMHMLPYCERLEALAAFKDTKYITRNERTLCRTEDQIRAAIAKYSDEPGSEGAMLKKADFIYELDRTTRDNIKYKKELSIDAQVIAANEVAGSTGTFTYDCALSGPGGLHYTGRTYNTNIAAKPGDIIKVSFADISGYTDEKKSKKWANWFNPHVLLKRTDKKSPDTIETAWRMAKETTGRFKSKPEPAVMASIKDHSAPAGSKRFVVQFHIRGASVHFDFRNEIESGVLAGFTIAPQKEDAFKAALGEHWQLQKKAGVTQLLWDGELYYEYDSKENIIRKPAAELERKVLAFHKKLVSNHDYWKIDLKTGEELKRADTGAEKVYAIQKTNEPKEWLDVEGITPPRQVEESPGGTRYYPGIFIIVDSGTYSPGAVKPYYNEYFLNGTRGWKGRFIFRQLALEGTKQAATWLYWKADNAFPYVLDARARREQWLPDGYSALPGELESKVPGALNYWKKGLANDERLRRRDELAKQLRTKLKEHIKQRAFSVELDFVRPTKPYRDDDKRISNEFFDMADTGNLDFENLIIECKYDGLRMQIHKKGDSVKAYSAFGNIFPNSKLGSIPADVRQMNEYSVVLDGELIHPCGGHDLVHGIVREDMAGSDKLEYRIFDIMHMNGISLMARPLSARKQFLAGMTFPGCSLKKVRYIPVRTQKRFGQAIDILRAGNFEGAVMKDARSEYQAADKWFKFVFIASELKQDSDLDKMDKAALQDYKITLNRMLRKIAEGKTTPLSKEDIDKQLSLIDSKERSFSNAQFVYTRRYWHGQKVIRDTDVKDFHVKIGKYQFHLDKDIRNKDSGAVAFTGIPNYFKPGVYKSGTDINPNKKLDVTVEKLDEGSVEIVREDDKILQFQFKGKSLSGMYLFRRTSPTDKVWSATKQTGPEKVTHERSHCRDIKLKFRNYKDFTNARVVLSSDLKFPYTGRTTAFASGVWHDCTYTWPVIRAAASKLLGAPMVVEHSNAILDKCGIVTAFYIDDKNEQVDVDFELWDTESGKDIAVLIENNQIDSVSVRLAEDSDFVNGKERCNEIIEWSHVAFVEHPEVTVARIKSKKQAGRK